MSSSLHTVDTRPACTKWMDERKSLIVHSFTQQINRVPMRYWALLQQWDTAKD